MALRAAFTALGGVLALLESTIFIHVKENNTIPFFFEQVEGKSLSSTFTEGLLHFILQKNDRLAPEQSLDGPGVMSVFTGRPAANTHTQSNSF